MPFAANPALPDKLGPTHEKALRLSRHCISILNVILAIFKLSPFGDGVKKLENC